MTSPVSTVNLGGGLTVGNTTGAAPPSLSSGTAKAQDGITAPNQQINVGSLAARLNQVGANLPATPTALQLYQAITSLAGSRSPAAHTLLGQLQGQLQYGSYYGSTTSYVPGVIGPNDLTAIKKAVNEAAQVAAVPGQFTAQGTPTPGSFDFTQNLISSAQAGQTKGIASALQARQTNIDNQISTFDNSAAADPVTTHFNKSQFFSLADTVGQSLVGRYLTTAEKNQLYDQYGVKSDAAQGKDTARAAQLNKLAKQVATDNQNVATALTGEADGPVASDTDPYDRAEAKGSPDTNYSVNQFLDAYAKTGTDPNNPFGFTPATWALYSRQAGLGPDAPQSNAANQQLVARYVALKAQAAFGSFEPAVAALEYGNPNAAKAYAANPDSTQWQALTPSGKSVTGQVNAINSTIQLTSPTATTGLDPAAGTPDLGGGSNASTDGLTATTDAQGNPVASVTPTDQEAPVYSPSDLITEGIKSGTGELNTEYQAHNLANTFGNFLSLLNGVGGSSSASI